MISIPSALEFPHCKFTKTYPCHPCPVDTCKGKDYWGDVALETVPIAIFPRTQFRFYPVQAHHESARQTSEVADVPQVHLSVCSHVTGWLGWAR